VNVHRSRAGIGRADDVEREDVGEAPGGIEEEGDGLAVDLDGLNGEPKLADLRGGFWHPSG